MAKFDKKYNDRVQAYSARFVKAIQWENMRSESELFDALMSYSEKSKYSEDVIFLENVFNKSKFKIKSKSEKQKAEIGFDEIDFFALPESSVFGFQDAAERIVSQIKKRIEFKKIEFLYEYDSEEEGIKKTESVKHSRLLNLIATSTARARRALQTFGSEYTMLISIQVIGKRAVYGTIFEIVEYKEYITKRG